MAKKSSTTRKSTKSGGEQNDPQVVTLQYHLDQLPTAQHKAGLAGLVLQIDSMHDRREAGALPADTELPEVTVRSPMSAQIDFTKRAVHALFDDLFDAAIVEQVRRQKQQNQVPKRVEQVEVKDRRTGKPKTEKRYVYDVVEPRGNFFRQYTEDGKESWLDLWRDMLLSIPRNQDKTKAPFRDTAILRIAQQEPTEWDRAEIARRKKDNAEKTYLHCRVAFSVWDDLKRINAASDNGNPPLSELSGALLLAAQSESAEALQYDDRADHAILLHFWPLTCRVFIPEKIDREGNARFPPNAYVIAIPEVRDLTGFCHAYIKILNELGGDRRSYRPKDAIISVPSQGSLEFMWHINELAQRRAIEGRASRYIDNIEYFHMVKVGNNAKMLAHGCVPPRDTLLAAYDGIRTSVQNVLFRSARIVALLRDRPWFAEFDALLHEREWSFFVHSLQERHRTPRTMVSFAYDAGKRFNELRDNYRKKKEAGMADLDQAAETVDRLVYELVHKYVRTRACAKARIEEGTEDWWKKTAEERQDVSSKLFLELRSRQGDDFVRHFTATLGSVPQWLDESRFLAVSEALMRDHSDETGDHRPRTRDDVKTLTLLALSAASRSLRYTHQEEQNTDQKGESP